MCLLLYCTECVCVVVVSVLILIFFFHSTETWTMQSKKSQVSTVLGKSSTFVAVDGEHGILNLISYLS